MLADDTGSQNITALQAYELTFGKGARIGLKPSKDEVFADIPGTGGKYRVSNMGRIISLQGLYAVELTQVEDKHGYLYVILRINKKSVRVSVSRTVAEAFCPKPETEEPLQVHHINRNPKDNRAENLQLLTVDQHRAVHRKKLK